MWHYIYILSLPAKSFVSLNFPNTYPILKEQRTFKNKSPKLFILSREHFFPPWFYSKIKFNVLLIKYKAMTTCGEWRYGSTIDRGEWSYWLSGRFTSQEEVPNTNRILGWVDLRPGEEKHFLPRQGIEPKLLGHPSRKPVAMHTEISWLQSRSLTWGQL
jgi:hypothetical protein